MCQIFIPSILFLSITLISTAIDAANIHSSVHTVISDGAERTYRMYRPSVPPSAVLPVMIVLHGGLGNAEYIERSSGMNAVADTGPFIAVYPNGTEGVLKRMKNRRTWNAGDCCGIAYQKNIDDVKFIEVMIEDVASHNPIDRTRIYVTGMSNGAMMAYRLACEKPDLFAAIIPVSGTLAVDSCERGKDVPVLHIHGELDEHVPYSGGRGRQSVARVDHRSVPETVKLMTETRQCGIPQKSYQENRTTSSYICAKGAPFTLVLLKNAGHSWPGKHEDAHGFSFHASEQAWNFARQFSKKPSSLPDTRQ